MFLYSVSNDDTPLAFDWAIHEFPAFFDLKNPCHGNELGKSLYDLSKHGRIIIPSQEPITFIDKDIKLKGLKTIWGRSLYLKSTNTSARACSNIMRMGKIKSAIATFTQNVGGSILFRENELQETLIYSNLFYNLEDARSTQNDWKIMVTDILDTNTEAKCNHLQLLLDPENTDDTSCEKDQQQSCKMGNMTGKHGRIAVGNNNNRYSKRFFMDLNFPLDYLESSRSLFVVIYWRNSNKVMTCAKIAPLSSKEVKAHFDADGVKGDITLKQNYKIDPTIVTIKLDNLRGRGKHLYIHQYPIIQKQIKDDNLCAKIGDRYNPFGIDPAEQAQNTNDQFEVGDLSGKHGPLSSIQDIQTYFNSYIDFNLPLFGTYSVVGRSIAIHKENGEKWICANIGYPGKTIIAKATFHYPVVGSIIFRQLADEPFSDTTVSGELFYSDGKLNVTRNHLWRVHSTPIGQDFYNWTKRCSSSEDNYNPFGINTGRTYNAQCSPDNQLRCQLGDLFLKYKRIDINYYSSNESTYFFYTDSLLPLTGLVSVININ